jgi:hypothetical protein
MGLDRASKTIAEAIFPFSFNEGEKERLIAYLRSCERLWSSMLLVRDVEESGRWGFGFSVCFCWLVW